MAKLGTEVPQFFENGVPCAGYIMYFGLPNQNPKTNPKAPYSDAAYSAALDENLTLDANGLFAAREVYLNGSYSLRLERPDGTEYWELESVEGFQGDAGSVTTTYVDAKVLEEISKNDMFHNDSSLNSGLSFSVGPYRVSRANGAVYEATTPTGITMNDGTTETLVFSVDDGLFYKVDNDSIESHHLPLYTVTTLAGAITTASIVDRRSHIDSRNRLPDDYITGLIVTINATDADNDLDIAAGQCTDSANKLDMALASGLTKQLDAVWSAGDNQGGLFTGSKAVSTDYYFFIISDPDGTVDAGFDVSASAANKPAGYTRYRQLCAFSTDASGNIDPDTFSNTDPESIGSILYGNRIGLSGLDTSFKSWTLIEDWALKTGTTLTWEQAAIAGFSRVRLEFRQWYDTNTGSGETPIYLNVRQSGVYSTDGDQRGIGDSIVGFTSWDASSSSGIQIIDGLPDSGTSYVAGFVELALVDIAQPCILTGNVFSHNFSTSYGLSSVAALYGFTGSPSAIDGFRLQPLSATSFNQSGYFRLLGQ
ncbi:hypothetical protein [uncultured Paraglaciecola sp.]|uniref:hypothetical protein n=1 Tax=uncultured Paraglaciecola sp. TaxID=1765024 RepID=UPI0026375E86|nr:hypothetical protein [uncultured Paraglaciecola sp.]